MDLIQGVLKKYENTDEISKEIEKKLRAQNPIDRKYTKLS